MKKIIIVVFFFFLIPFKAYGLDVNAENAILYSLDSNKIVYEKNSNDNVKIASLTKIMTVLVLLDEIEDLQTTITITGEMLEGLEEANASVVGFKVGDKVTYKDLLYGALLPSGADATRAIAISLYGSENAFVKIMNEKAVSLGMNDTLFTNSSGLDNNNQKATLNDLLKMMVYALENKTFNKAFESDKYVSSTGKVMEKTLARSALAYDLDIAFIKGSKTGFTNPAGLCLISTAGKDESYLLITTGSRYTNIYQPLHIIDALNIYNYYFDNYDYKTLLKKDELIKSINVKYSEEKIRNFYVRLDIKALLKKDDKITYEYKGANELTFKNKKGDCVGSYLIKVNDEVYDEIQVCLDKDVKFNIISFLNVHFYIYIMGIIVVFGLLKLKK